MRRCMSILVMFLGCYFQPLQSYAQSTDFSASLFREFKAVDLTYDEKRFLQTALAFAGHYNGLLDGDWGKLSQAGLEQYARQKFGSPAEDWHMAALVFDFLTNFDVDRWNFRFIEGLNMSMLYPYEAVTYEPPTKEFVNWKHDNSSLSYSIAISSKAEAEGFHNYTAERHSSSEELYILRRTNVAITSATLEQGGVIYTRSNFIDGLWSTVILHARRQDIPILNAVAASLSVGRVRPLTFKTEGRLSDVVNKTVAMLSEDEGTEREEPSKSSNALPPKRTKTSGTGFIVSSEGYALTNAHVIDGCETVRINGEPAEVIATSEEFDLALMRSERWEGNSFASFSPSPARLNSDVTVVGYPLKGILSGLNVTRGAVSSQLGVGGQATRMQITAPVQAGNSGGPVLASDGEVVGVVVSKLDAQVIADTTGDTPQNVNFAIRGEIAKLFLVQNGVEPKLGTSNEAKPPVQLAEEAASFTTLIECE